MAILVVQFINRMTIWKLDASSAIAKKSFGISYVSGSETRSTPGDELAKRYNTKALPVVGALRRARPALAQDLHSTQYFEMDRKLAVERLKRHAPELSERGIAHLSLFGSTARGEAGAESDVDLLVDLDPKHRFTLVKLSQLRRYVSEILEADAEITIREDVKNFLRDSIAEDEIRVF